MRALTRPWLFASLLCASLPVSALAQSGSSQSGSSPEQKSAASQAQAQPSRPDPAGASSSKTDTAKGKKPKKVWTEEDMSRLGGEVSVVGETKSGSTAPSGAGRTVSDGPTYYRNRLTPLRQKLEGIEKQIRDLQNAKLGGRDNIARPMERLEAQRKDVLAQIEAIEEEARKNGVEPGQLR